MAFTLQPGTTNISQHSGGLFAAHHGDAGVWPRPEEARVVGTTAHAVVTGAEAAPDDNSKLGYPCAGYRCHHLGAVLGDTTVFRLFSHHEASNVLKENQRNTALTA